MALEGFENEPDEKAKRYSRMRSTMDIGMGVIWIGMGIFLLFPNKFGDRFAQFDNVMMKAFASVCLLYGCFRIYRGYKKDYYKER